MSQNPELVEGRELAGWLDYGIDEAIRSRLEARHELTLPFLEDADFPSTGDSFVPNPEELLKQR